MNKKKLIYNDKLNKVIAGTYFFKISIWSIVHYLYYFILAYFFSNIYFLIIIGICWEIIEDIASKYTKGKKFE